MMYGAYVHIPEEFPTFEEAMRYLEQSPGTEGMEPVFVSLLTETTPAGARAEPVDGESVEESDNQVFLVTVSHQVMGKKFNIEYMVEFANITEEEEDGEVGEDGDDPEAGPGHEAGVEQPDEGAEQPSEGEEPESVVGTEIERWESDGGEPVEDEVDSSPEQLPTE